MRKQVADPGPALAALGEVEHAGGDRERFLRRGHPGEPLAHADAVGQVFGEPILELRLVVEQVKLRRGPRLEQINDPLGFAGEVGLLSG